MTKTSRVRILALALLLAALAAAPLAAKEPFAPRHVAKLRSVSAAVISPDGTPTAYPLTLARPPGRRARPRRAARPAPPPRGQGRRGGGGAGGGRPGRGVPAATSPARST